MNFGQRKKEVRREDRGSGGVWGSGSLRQEPYMALRVLISIRIEFSGSSNISNGDHKGTLLLLNKYPSNSDHCIKTYQTMQGLARAPVS